MKPPIAVVGMACRYADAPSPEALWQNVLAQRRAFRRLPPERLRLEDYHSPDRTTPDATYGTEAAVLEGWEFDRLRFRVVGSTFRSADLAHWLALEVAADALADAGFSDGQGLPRPATGVLLGNTLTGEFSRAALLRHRWPYVRRMLAPALAGEGIDPERAAALLARLEQDFKKPFEPVGEESLAGGLANTIAGRICNHFDLGGGGFTLDGACASSLLAVAQAATALALGDLDVALAGGVDLSLDPFELVGFAKAGALAEGEMRVYDARSDGFIPGEGCGVVVLMRLEDALAQGRRVRAVLRGWGISSDGSGGITRPELEGQLLALRRAYRRAGFGAETVAYFEGHGTGTKVGDATELRALATLRREAMVRAVAAEAEAVPVAAVGSVKANIGHTKAAAGAAGLIKTALALEQGLLPPTTGCSEPHPELLEGAPVLRVLETAEPWPRAASATPRRAGVSAMGFGGINVHLALEAAASEPRRSLTAPERRLLASPQDAELFLFAGRDAAELERGLARVATVAAGASRAELGDLAGELARSLAGGPLRAAVTAARPAQLAEAVVRLRAVLAEGRTRVVDARQGWFLSTASTVPRVGFLFPGQGAPAHLDGGLWRRRFRAVETLYEGIDAPGGDGVATEVAQPAIVRASLAGLVVLGRLGLEAQVALGHSLGELVALCWAGAITAPALERLAARRGRAMAELGHPTGAMAQIEAAPAVVEALLTGHSEVVVACFNGPEQTVISGPRVTVAAVAETAHGLGLRARELAVSHAFHSPLVAAAAAPLVAALAAEELAPLERRVISTVTGTELDRGHDLRSLLTAQLTSPVRFVEALAAAPEVDLWIEVGPGRSAAGLAEAMTTTPVIALDAGGRSLEGLLRAVGAAWALGAEIDVHALFSDRFLRPFDLARPRRFLTNPCELAPVDAGESALTAPAAAPAAPLLAPDPETGALEVLRALVARRTELPGASIAPEHRLLSDLHLSSIAVGQLIAETSKQLGLPPSAAATEYADASLREIAQALDELRRTGSAASTPERQPAGVDAWVRAFAVVWVERPSPRAWVSGPPGSWQILDPAQHPLRAVLERELPALPGGDGVALLLSPEPGRVEEAIGGLLAVARAVLAQRPGRCLFLHHPASGFAASGFAKTLHLETGVPTLAIALPPQPETAPAKIAAELLALGDFAEVAYDAEGVRREPVLRALPLSGEEAGTPPCGPGDVLLVTGGGKGIAAECARALATRFGARLAILGRSQPASDGELAANLDRLAVLGLAFRYAAADVGDPAAVARAVGELESELGPITGLLHGAGVNHPRLLASLGDADFRATVEPKTDGLAHLLAALDPGRLRVLIGFGSVIARTGLRGEADYAAANEWLGQEVGRFAAAHPGCRCLQLEWSVWSGVGMGERLGRIDALVQGGITPIPPDAGVAMLERLLLAPPPAVSVVVSGRFADVPTLRLERPELPLRRFLEQPKLCFPGIELVAQIRLAVATDPYLAEHVYRGERLLPAVIGLEAMAQAAMALAETHELPSFEDARFERPVVVPAGEGLEVRVAALVRAPGLVDVVLRSAATSFQIDHFRVRCRFAPVPEGSETYDVELPGAHGLQVALDVDRDVYEPLLFHTGRFRRVAGYRRLLARQTVAELGRGSGADWFGGFMPRELMLGDPGLRDAAIHALQVSVPHRTLLPIAVERLEPGRLENGKAYTLHARERRREGDVFVYDLEIRDAGGHTVERWHGLRLRALAPREPPAVWPAPLVGPYLARRVEELVAGAAVEVVLERGGLDERPGRTDRALARLTAAKVVRRADGKPELPEGPAISVAHAGDLVLAAAAAGAVGCDLEPVVERAPELWRDLLGPERAELAAVVASETGEEPARAATRVWTAGECLKKAGLAPSAPLVFVSHTGDGWVLLAAGEIAVASWVGQVAGAPEPVAFALLAGHAAAVPASWEAAAHHAGV